MEEIGTKGISKNELMFFDDLRKLLENEPLYYDGEDTDESLYDIVMKAFALYVEGICGADELFSMLEDVFRHIDEFEQFKSF